MEADKSQVADSKLETQENWWCSSSSGPKAWDQESQWCSSSPKANRLKTQEEPIFQLGYKSREKTSNVQA